MAIGIVKFFNETKGFGFIAPQNGGGDAFVHITAVKNAGFDLLRAGQVVSYEMVTERGRPAAANLGIAHEFSTMLGPPVEFVCELPPPAEIEAIARPIEDLLARVRKNTGLLRLLSPKEFEEFSLELLQQEGLEATLVSKWNQADGGADIIAIKKLGGGIHTKFAIQCKIGLKKIDAVPIRSLAGVLDKFQAHKGIVMTTSLFTQPAIDEVSQDYWKISLRDYRNILQSLRDLGLIKK